MDDEDDGGAWAHQMELEQRQREEEAIERSRKLTAVFRASNEEFERDMQALTERIRSSK